MRYFGSQFVTVAVLTSLIACARIASGPPLPGPRIEFGTWGGPASPRFAVYLLSDDRLTVDRESLPFTDNGMTLRQEIVQLSHAESDELVQLARQADDFAEGCMSVADGTSAEIRINENHETLTRRCDMAREWPAGVRTKAFLQRLNGHLSKEMHVF